LTLATCLNDELRGCHGIDMKREAQFAVIRGSLNLSHDNVVTVKSAWCEFLVRPNWRACVPAVRCLDPWVRSDPDWHAFGGALCFVLDDEWRDCVTRVYEQEGPRLGASYATQLCVRNVRWLLYRHFISHTLRIDKWPTEWPARPHAEAGRKQYLMETSQRRTNK